MIILQSDPFLYESQVNLPMDIHSLVIFWAEAPINFHVYVNPATVARNDAVASSDLTT